MYTWKTLVKHHLCTVPFTRLRLPEVYKNHKPYNSAQFILGLQNELHNNPFVIKENPFPFNLSEDIYQYIVLVPPKTDISTVLPCLEQKFKLKCLAPFVLIKNQEICSSTQSVTHWHAFCKPVKIKSYYWPYEIF